MLGGQIVCEGVIVEAPAHASQRSFTRLAELRNSERAREPMGTRRPLSPELFRCDDASNMLADVLDMGDRMPAKLLRLIVIAALCFSGSSRRLEQTPAPCRL